MLCFLSKTFICSIDGNNFLQTAIQEEIHYMSLLMFRIYFETMIKEQIITLSEGCVQKKITLSEGKNKTKYPNDEDEVYDDFMN